MTLLAAFAAVLSVYSGQEEVAFGSPLADGDFNTLVLRLDLAGAPTFRELLGRVREATGETGRGLANLDLALTVRPAAGGIELEAEYRKDLFDAVTVRRLLGHLEILLAAAVAEPGARLSELPLLTGPERHQVVLEWAATAGFFAADAPVHRLVAAQARCRPEALAVASREDRLSYGELGRRALRLAGRLRELGAGPEERVAVCLERSCAEVVALLGVLESGGAYVPLDPSHPRERRLRLLADCGARLLVTDERGAGELSGSGARVVFPDEEPERAESAKSEACGDNLAYVIYTSGSTGEPKGVGVAHAGLSNLVGWHRRAFGVAPEDRVSRLAGLAFDASVWELWPYLAAGASVHLPPEEVRTSPAALGGWLAQEGITVSFLPTPLAEALLADVDLEGLSLRALLTGGDRLHHHPPAGLGFPLVNNYGPTECTVVSTSGVVPPADSADPSGRLPAIGRPIANLRARVMDLHGRPAPPGVPGELCIGGRSLARGYLGSPGRTAERFVPDPLAAEPGERVYRTGDRARFLVDGSLEFLGRLDRQIKVRGHRIEPAEIEAALTCHPGVREAVVVAREEASGSGARLVAYVVPEPGEEGVSAELAGFLRASLPEPMVPTAWVELAALPLTPNGKVDRAALPAPGADRPSGEDRPRSPVEELLVQLWAEVLGIESPGIHDDFFALGGHSLLATRVTSRVSALLGVDLSVRELFEHPTAASLAERVEELSRAGRASAPPLRPGRHPDRLPLSFAQQRLWFLHQMAGSSPVYPIFRAFSLPAAPNPAALEAALREVMRRHEVLRTRFPRRDGEPVQEISPRVDLFLPLVDLAGLPPAAHEAELRRWIAEEYRRPFDLAAGPVLRAVLLRGPREHALLLGIHHIAIDGWSMDLLMDELATLYEAVRAGRPSPLPEPAVQYADFALWQREWLQGEVLQREVEHWSRRLAGAPALLELPADRPRPPVQSFRGGQRSAPLPAELAAAVERLGRQEGVTLFMTLLAAFQALLGRYTGRDDLVVGTPIANRHRLEVEGTIGFFVNTLVLRADLSGDPPFRELLGRVRETALDAYAHQDLPFDKLVEELRPERHLSHSPLFQVMFVLQEPPRRPLAGLEPGDLELVPLPVEITAAKLDLTLLAERGGSGDLTLLAEYAADLFDAATVQRLLGHLRCALSSAVADPGARLSTLDLLTSEERGQTLREWNDSQADCPPDLPLDRLLALWAARTPDEPALIAPVERLSYRELDERCNRLARHLRRQGFGPDAIAAVLLDRSVELVVAILAILRAGGAYLPLDPAYPGERLLFMLRDSRPALLLSTAALAGTVAPEERPPTILLDADRERIAAEDAGDLAPAAAPDHLAYVIYTSGSTGRPKGVQVVRRGLTNLAERQLETFGLGAADRVLQFASPSFDASIFEVALALRAGAALCLMDRADLLPGRGFLERLRRDQVSAVVLPPSVLAALPEDGGLPGLTTVIVAGEACPADLVARWAPGRQFFNAYGPTEATVWSTVAQCAPDGRQPPIGRPIGNTRVYVLDRHLAALPVGVPGQLHLGGLGLARGYLRRPELTAERFLPDPFAGAGGRLYATGDLVRLLPDGNLEFLGRIDHQVKVRGFRIELGEVEAALARCPAVREALVLARDDGRGQTRLVAYVVPRGETEPDAGELRAFLRQSLPDYAVPAAFVVLAAFPQTPNGKVDRAALPAPAGPAPAGASRGAPRNELERVIAAIWAEVLRSEEPGAHDNFFDIGGHSLLVATVQDRLEAALGRPVPILELLRYPTVRSLAERLAAGNTAPAGPSVAKSARPEERSGSAARRRELRDRHRQSGHA